MFRPDDHAVLFGMLKLLKRMKEANSQGHGNKTDFKFVLVFV